VGQIDNLAQGNLGDILRRLRALEFASNQNNMAVGRGGIRVHGGGGITIENGGLVVSGSATISGLLEATGTINMTGTFTATGDVNLNGPTDVAGNLTITGDVTSAGHFTQTGPTDLNGVTTIAGNTTVTGDFNVNGPMKTTGTLSVEGVTTLKNDLNVTTGKIKVGSAMTLDPSVSGGSVAFSGGGGLQGASGVTVMKGAGNAGFLSNDTASMFAGANSVDVGTTYVTINGPMRNTGMPTTASAANVYYNPSTQQFYYKP